MLRRFLITTVAFVAHALLTTSPASGQVRTIDRSSLSPALRVALDSGRGSIVGAGPTTTVPRRPSQVRLAEGQFVVARTHEAPRTVVRRPPLGGVEPIGGAKPDTVILLPLRFLGSDDDDELVELRPVLGLPKPAVLLAANGVFRGSLSIGLEDVRDPARARRLAAGVQMRAATDGDSILPGEFVFEETNRRLWEVSVFSHQPLDSIRVRISPQFNQAGIDVWIPVKPAIVVPGVPAHATGFGFETIQIPVTIRGSRPRDSVIVALSSDRGNLTSARLAIDPGGTAIAMLRTRGLGPARITAETAGFTTAEVTIHFGWPIPFLLAAIGGGLVGGAMRELHHPRRRIRTRVRRLLAGVLVGIVVAVVYFVLGVNLLRIDFSAPFLNEGAVFALAILGSVFGSARLAGSASAQADVSAPA